MWYLDFAGGPVRARRQQMKKLSIVSAVLMIALFMTIGTAAELTAGDKNMNGIFPQLKGWTHKGKPDFYNADNLFEYINGAADVFLAYDFRELATLTYENEKKHSFTVDVYRHSSDTNGFGIYSAEKPRQGDYIKVGTQGYYEKGVLNFLKGRYYVKLSGFDLGDNDKVVLTMAARALAGILEGKVKFPEVLDCFPEKGKIPRSERYISENFLGHSFLHSAFLADYERNGQKYEVFIIETPDIPGADKLLQSYLAFLEKKGKQVNNNNNYYRFQDPYYRSSGTMNLKKSKNYIWGLFSKDDEAAVFFIDAIGENLKAKKRI